MIKSLKYFLTISLCIGIITITKYIICCFIWLLLYIKNKLLSKNLKKYGDTVIITGCTSGIGKELIYQFIKENINLILISRNEEELIKIKNDIKKNYNYNGIIDIIVFDFNTSDFTSYKKIEDVIKNKDIGILINNAGISYPTSLYYNEIDVNLINDLVNINLLSYYYMTKLVLPIMQKKKKGKIIFTSSMSSMLKSCPLLAVYASVKSAINSFANSLSVEMKEYNIKIQCHLPFYVATKLSKIRKPSLFSPSAKKYAKCIFDIVIFKSLNTIRIKGLKKMKKN